MCSRNRMVGHPERSEGSASSFIDCRSLATLGMTAMALACAPKPDAAVDSVIVAAPPTQTVTAATPPAASPAASKATPAAPTPRPTTPQQPATADIHPEDQGIVVAPKLSQVDTTITLRANGTELIFDPATITLKQGTRVRLRFVNMGTFAHNLILARDESDLDELAQRARDASENVP